MKTRLIVSLALFSTLIYACSKSSDDDFTNEPPPGPGGCDTANMKYMANVVPILQANCYSCHGTGSNSGSNGIVLEGYENLQPRAASGTLLGVITHANGFPAMPQGGAKLSECNINKIRSWISHGALNN